ncbi:MAG TPA: VWA domain-containing protein [Bryobacteraceae bacterium]|nr:VWA domain-containing protein [Bryobacteraceae bacterium]
MNAQAPPAGDDAVTIRTTTKLIQVNVVVHGRDGKVVSGLKQADFRLLEDGKPQAISFFSVDDARKPPGVGTKLPENVFSNNIGRDGVSPTSVTAIVIDALNTDAPDQAYARQQVLKFLSQVQPQDRVALFTIGRGLRVLHDYTSDSAALLVRLDRYLGQNTSLLGDSEAPPPPDPDQPLDVQQQLEQGVQIRSALFATRQRVETTLQSLQAVGTHLAGLPGRKSIVWVTAGFPLVFQAGQGSMNWEVESFGPKVTRVIQILNDSNVAVYPVDARGLMADPGFSAATASAPSRNARIWSPPNHETMIEFANRTGGKAFYNRNDVGSAVREAVEDGRITYTLAYYPRAAEKEDKFRKIKVEVTRPGFQVRHRKGYIAQKEVAPAAQQIEEDLRHAMWSPVDSTMIPVNGRVDQAEGSDVLRLVLQISLQAVTIQQEGDRWNGKLAFTFVQKDEEGKTFNGSTDTLTLKLTSANYNRMMKEGLLFARDLKRNPAAKFLKVAVVDPASGAVGTMTVPFSRVVAHKPAPARSNP